mmetsp:Transcript_8453/g.7574  ORF Transcript_8453/g.7574 Transcript_8453/m.7574 type:complete len:653 (+) Transcript_8453:60-2018(+)
MNKSSLRSIVREVNKLLQEKSDKIGIFWTNRRRSTLYIFILLYYIIELIVSSGLPNHSNKYSRVCLISIESITLIISLICLIGCWIDIYTFDKFFLRVDGMIISLQLGWIVLTIISHSIELILFIFLNAIVIILLLTIDISTQKIRYESSRMNNYNAFHRIRNSSRSLSTANHDFQSISPTVNEDPHDDIVLNINNNNAYIDKHSSQDFLSSKSIDDIAFEGFRVKISTLPKRISTTQDNLSWDSLSYIEHRIDSSSCHIYTAIWCDTPVIVKLIKADRIHSPMAVSEFEMEASILSRVNHPNIVRLLGSGHIPRRFLVLELLDGGSLSHALGIRPDANKRYNKKKFSYLQVLHMSRSIAQAMEYLHDKWTPGIHIIHRDLKPDNIGWTGDSVLKIFDFGLCACVKAQSSNAETYRLTGNTGTLRYMAPEVALGRGYNNTVDVYSFGIILWQVLKNKIPFKNMSKKMYMERVVMGGLRPSIDKRWNKRLQSLLESCWHEDKSHRPNFSDIIIELNALINDAEIKETNGWNFLKNTLISYSMCCYQFLLWSRPFLTALFVGIITAAIAVIILDIGENNDSRTKGRSDVIGVSLIIIAVFGCHTIFMSFVRGSSRRPMSSRDLILGLELSHIEGSKSFNPMSTNNDNVGGLYGL